MHLQRHGLVEHKLAMLVSHDDLSAAIGRRRVVTWSPEQADAALGRALGLHLIQKAERQAAGEDLHEVQIQPSWHDALLQYSDLHAFPACGRNSDRVDDGEPHVALLGRHARAFDLPLVALPTEPVQIQQAGPEFVALPQIHLLLPLGLFRRALDQIPEDLVFPIADAQLNLPSPAQATALKSADALDPVRPTSDAHHRMVVAPSRILDGGLVSDMDYRGHVADRLHTLGELLGVEAKVHNAIVAKAPGLQVVRLVIVSPRNVGLQREVPGVVAGPLVLHALDRQAHSPRGQR
mmetsp:Transcript_93660/g.269684  ORF Transcript_93660/g.269684 Transcript_93660/m.269684 type:complete len:293 (+) Transcript_93660:309-1187(+)